MSDDPLTPFLLLLVGLTLGLAFAGRPRSEGKKARRTIVFALLYLAIPPLLAWLAYWAAGQPVVQALGSEDGVPSALGVHLLFSSIVLCATWVVTLPVFAFLWLLRAARTQRSQRPV